MVGFDKDIYDSVWQYEIVRGEMRVNEYIVSAVRPTSYLVNRKLSDGMIQYGSSSCMFKEFENVSTGGLTLWLLDRDDKRAAEMLIESNNRTIENYRKLIADREAIVEYLKREFA